MITRTTMMLILIMMMVIKKRYPSNESDGHQNRKRAPKFKQKSYLAWGHLATSS